MNPFSIALRDLRLRLGLRQEELAVRLGYEQTYISALERGSRGPPGEKILSRLGEKLQLSADEQARLATAAQQSRRRFVLPGDAPGEVFEMCSELFRNLDRLHPVQVGMIREIVRIPETMAQRLPSAAAPIRSRRRRKEVMGI